MQTKEHGDIEVDVCRLKKGRQSSCDGDDCAIMRILDFLDLCSLSASAVLPAPKSRRVISIERLVGVAELSRDIGVSPYKIMKAVREKNIDVVQKNNINGGNKVTESDAAKIRAHFTLRKPKKSNYVALGEPLTADNLDDASEPLKYRKFTGTEWTLVFDHLQGHRNLVCSAERLAKKLDLDIDVVRSVCADLVKQKLAEEKKTDMWFCTGV